MSSPSEVLIYYRTGLATDPTLFNADGSKTPNTFCGSRAPLESLQTILSSDLWVVAWDDPTAAQKLADARANYKFIVMGGHSHGAEAARKDAETLPPNSIDCGYLIDDCEPWAPLDEFLPPIMPPAAFKSSDTFWQRNAQPQGKKFLTTAKSRAHDVTTWRNANGQALGHIDQPINLASIAGDPGVWAWIEMCAVQAYNDWKIGGS